MRLYAVEVDAARAGGTVRAIDKGWGARPAGPLARRPLAVSAADTVRASDLGYRTLAADAGGLQVYPPLVQQALAITRQVNVSPEGSAVAAGAGRLVLANPSGRYDAMASGYTVDGRAVRVLTGTKTYEAPGGPYTIRPTTGTYLDANGVLREAAAGAVRWDYGTGSAVALDEATAQNMLRNPRGEGAVAADGVERVTNGTFAADPINAAQNTVQNGWQWSRAGGAVTATWVSNAVLLTTDGTNTVRLDTSFTTVAGQTYTMLVDIATSTVTCLVGASQGSGALLNTTITAGTAQPRQFVATGTTTWVRFHRTSVGNATIDNVSIQSAGKLPTNWAVVSTGGLYTTVVAVGSVSGVPRVSVRVWGTSTGTVYTLQYDSAIAGLNGESWTISAWTSYTAGALTNITTISNTANVTAGANVTATHTPTASPVRRSVSGALSADASIDPRLALTFNTSQAINCTFDIGAPNLVKAAAVSSAILPPVSAPAAATRSADLLYFGRGLWRDPSYSTLVPVYKGMAASWYLTNGALEIPVRDASLWLEGALSVQYYAGSGGYGGHSGLSGTAKPQTRGGTASYPVRNVRPVLIDAVNRIYQWTDGAGTVVAVREAGNLAFTAGANVADLLVGSTTAGQYRTDNVRGCFQLGLTAVGEITCDVTGEFPVAGVVTNWATITRYLLSETCAVPSANMDTGSFTTAAASYPYTAGVHFNPGDALSCVEAVDRILSSVGARLVPLRTGALSLIVLRALAAATVPVLSIGRHNAGQPSPVTTDQVPYLIRLLHNRNHTVQTSGVSVSTTDANRAFIGSPGLYTQATSATAAAAYARPRVATVGGGALLIASEAQTVVDAMGARWSARQRIYTIPVPVEVGLTVDLGSVVRLTWPMDDLASGRLALVVGDDFKSQDSTMRLRLWL